MDRCVWFEGRRETVEGVLSPVALVLPVFDLTERVFVFVFVVAVLAIVIILHRF